MRGKAAVLAALALLWLLGCKEPDPFQPLLLNEDFGLGTPLGSPYSDVEGKIEQSLGKRVAENNHSTDPRYYDFRDIYNLYRFIIGDINQDRRVDTLVLAINSQLNLEQHAREFTKSFPNVRTMVGVTLGTEVTEVIKVYQFGEYNLKSMAVESRNRRLTFRPRGQVVAGMRLTDEFSSQMPVSLLEQPD